MRFLNALGERLSVALLILVSAGLCTPANSETWQLLSGESVSGEIDRVKNGIAIIQLESGGMRMLSLEVFQPDDREAILQAFPDGVRQAPLPNKPARKAPVVATEPVAGKTTPSSEAQPQVRVVDGEATGPQLAVRVELPKSSTLRVGQMAPELGALKQGSHETVALEDLRGRWVLVDFWSMGDRITPLDAPRLHKVYQHFNPYGFEIISICMDRRASQMDLNHFEARHGIVWPVTIDTYGRNADRWGVESPPTRLLINPNGVVHADQVSVEKLVRLLNGIYVR